ncbi:MAG: TIM44-like domain-containing protein, partial [Holosporaceae bacterium]|nr:TIM44-like domain-containing protein [Holosporaceae bacterium]
MGFILFALLTFFLLNKLNEILGMRIGFRIKKENLYDIEKNKNSDQKLSISEVDKKALKIRKAYPAFNSKDFLKKSEKAFAAIFEAYSKGDVKTLKGLLSPRIFHAFSMAV